MFALPLHVYVHAHEHAHKYGGSYEGMAWNCDTDYSEMNETRAKMDNQVTS